jgi:hypothetical protein
MQTLAPENEDDLFDIAFPNNLDETLMAQESRNAEKGEKADDSTKMIIDAGAKTDFNARLSLSKINCAGGFDFDEEDRIMIEETRDHERSRKLPNKGEIQRSLGISFVLLQEL